MAGMSKRFPCLWAGLFITIAWSAQADEHLRDNEEAGNRDRFLMIDSRIIARTENAELTLGTVSKDARNPLFEEDKEWEKRFDNLYANVLYDEQDGIYKCWYSPFIVDNSAKGMTREEWAATDYDSPPNREMGLCYATSEDGIHWTKPELGIVEYGGNTKNNIVWRGTGEGGDHGDGPHGTGVFKDLRDPDPGRRYKALLKKDILSVAFSPDGMHWGPAIVCPEADSAGDTHNNAFWSPTLNTYVGITREWGEPFGRQVARTTTDDFLKWTESKVVLEGLERNFQTYAMPVFYHGGIYLGLVAIHNQEADRVWTELTWSPDTITWNRVLPGTPLIPNSDEEGAYDWGCVYTAANPVFLEDEIRLYYGASDGNHSGWRNGYFCLATLRPDGFAGYTQDAPGAPAIVTTTGIARGGRNLQLSADVEQGGFVRVKMLDAEGNVLTESAPVESSVTDKPIVWKNGASIDGIQTSEVSFQFEFEDATLYSFSFADRTSGDKQHANQINDEDTSSNQGESGDSANAQGMSDEAAVGGRVPMSWVIFSEPNEESEISVFTEKGAVTLESLDVYELNSIWDEGHDEIYRPQFHYSPITGEMGDPNGLVYYDGEYHLFYQGEGWGHAVSTDLVHWQQLPTALTAEEHGGGYDVYSGSCVVDYDNTAGFKSGDEDAIVALYTINDDGMQSQAIAYSNDRGRTFTPYAGNPVMAIEYDKRDPKVFWYEPDSKWVMALHNEYGVEFYSSLNLKDWSYMSRVEGFYECPDIFELPIDGDPKNTKWVLLDASNTGYMLGQFDGTAFIPETAGMPIDFGRNHYATQTFSNIPESDGRRIQIAWMKAAHFPGMPFDQQHTFPSELSLRTYADGVRLYRAPVREIERIRGKHYRWSNVMLKDGDDLLGGIDHELIEIIAVFDLTDSTSPEFGFFLRDAAIYYYVAGSQLTVEHNNSWRTATLKPENNKIAMHILLDRSSLELYAG